MASLAAMIAKKAGFAIAAKGADAAGVDLSSLGIGDSAELRQIQAIQKDIKQIIHQQEALKAQVCRPATIDFCPHILTGA